MSKSTQRRSVIGRTLVLLGAMFASGSADKKVFAGGQKSKAQYAAGTGWGGGAVYTPKRKKFRGYMRDPQWRAKRNKK